MINVGPDKSRPTHHVKLSRDGIEIGLILCDASGDADETAIRRDNMPDTAIKMYQGSSTHADAEPPFRPIEQKDWSGGRALRVFEDATDRYDDGGGVDAARAGKLFLAGLDTYTTGLKTLLMDMPGNVTYGDLYGTTRFRSQAFTVGGSDFTTGYIEAIVEFVGDPGNLTLAVYTDSGGSPNTLVTSSAYPTKYDQRMMYHLRLSLGTTLTAGTTYHFVIYGASTDDALNYWRVALGGTAGKTSSDGAAWTAATTSPYYRLTETDGGYYLRFFEYKRGFYCVKIYDDNSNSNLYRCGTRGVADSNAGNLDRLIDGTNPWTAGAEAGNIVLIYKGPGSEEWQSWREIDDNDTGILYVSPDWGIEHTGATEYIVYGDVWTLIDTCYGPVTDIAVTDDYVYFARGENAAVMRYQEYITSAGAWTYRFDAENENAHQLLQIHHPTLGPQLYGTRNEHSTYRTSVWKAQIPKAWGDCYNDLGEAFPTDVPWDTRQLANVTNTVEDQMTRVEVAAGFSTGIIAVQNQDDPVDLGRGETLGILIKSDLDLIANDLQLVWEDQYNLGKAWSPSGGFVVDYNGDPPTYADIPRAIDGNGSTAEEMLASKSRRPITTNAMILFHTEQFNRVGMYLWTPVNAAVSTLSAYYYNGSMWMAVTNLSDGTAVAGGTVTFGQNGYITFDIPYDWEQCTINNVTGYAIQFRFSVDLTDGIKIQDFTLARDNTIVTRSANIAAALPANQWVWAVLDVGSNRWPLPNERAIKSVGLNLTRNVGAFNLSIRGGIRLMTSEAKYSQLPADCRITGIHAYAGSTTDLSLNPWVFTDKGIIYEMQGQNDDQLVPLGLDELQTLSGENTGKASTTQGLYLWFSLGRDYIERYYNHQVDDMGYNRDEGLPTGRRGAPAKMLAWTDNIIVAVDAGDGNTSSVMLYNGRGWHELYRAPKYGIRIRDIAVQVVPDRPDRLWINLGDEAIYVPLSTNPLTESRYYHKHFGYLETAMITGGMQDVIKYIHSLKLATEYLTPGYYTIQADYKLAGENDWTPIEGEIDTSPYDELAISEDYDKTTRWLNIRYRLYSRSINTTPVIYGSVLQTMMFSQVKHVYSLTFRLKDKDVDLLGDRDGIGFMDKFNQLDTWVQGALPVLFNSNSKLDDGTYVFPGPTPVRRLRIIKDPVSHEETHICQMTLIGI